MRDEKFIDISRLFILMANVCASVPDEFLNTEKYPIFAQAIKETLDELKWIEKEKHV